MFIVHANVQMCRRHRVAEVQSCRRQKCRSAEVLTNVQVCRCADLHQEVQRSRGGVQEVLKCTFIVHAGVQRRCAE